MRYFFVAAVVLAAGLSSLTAQFAAPHAVTPSESLKRLALLDVDSDGDEDLFCVRKQWDNTTQFAWFERRSAAPMDYAPLSPLPGTTCRYIREYTITDWFGDGRPAVVYRRDGGVFLTYPILPGQDWLVEQLLVVENAWEIDDVVVADLSGNGLPDLLTTYDHGVVSRYYANDGAGGLADGVPLIQDSLSGDFEPQYLDVDGDGDLDVLSTRYELRVFQNNGDTFSALPPGHASGYSPPTYLPFNFNQDNLVDLLYSDDPSDDYGGVHLLMQTDSGTFEYDTLLFDGLRFEHLQALDMNQDGLTDVVGISMAQEVIYFPRRADGGLGNPVDYTAMPTPNTVTNTLLDLNADGYPEPILRTEAGDVRLTVYDSTTATLEPSEPIFRNVQLRGLLGLPLDADDRLDMVVVNSRTDFLAITTLRNTSDTDFGVDSIYSIDRYVHWMIGGDYNMDGAQDIALLSDSSSTMTLLLNNGEGVFLNPVQVGLPGMVAIRANNLLKETLTLNTLDMDGDGDVDLPLNIHTPQGVRFGFAVNNGMSFGSFVELADKEIIELRRLDFNADGLPDLLTRVYSGSNQPTRLFLSEEDDSMIALSLSYNWPNPNSPATFQDLNGDSLPDALRTINNAGMLSVHENQNGTDFSSGTSYSVNVDAFSGRSAFADFNGDGHTDLLTSRSFTPDADWDIRLGNGPYQFGTTTPLKLPVNVFYTAHFEADDYLGSTLPDVVAGFPFTANTLSRTNSNNWFNTVSPTVTVTGSTFNGMHVVGRTYWDRNENGQMDGDERGLPPTRISFNTAPTDSWPGRSGEFARYVTQDSFEVAVIPPVGWVSAVDSLQVLNLLPNGGQFVQFPLIAGDPLDAVSLSLHATLSRCSFASRGWVIARNSGNTVRDLEVRFLASSFVTAAAYDPPATATHGDTLVWQFAAVEPFDERRIVIDFTNPGVWAIDSVITAEAWLRSQDEDGNEVAADYRNVGSPLTCAYDPNDKQVEPSYSNYPNYILLDDTLFYTIRFQNTGNDTAFNVRITDPLDHRLDPASITLLGSSHLVRAELEADRQLVFYFDDILLPDSAANFVGSMGFVQFSARALPGLDAGQAINNTANIYFDFNPAIVTNTVQNALVAELPVIAAITGNTCSDGTSGRVEVQFPYGEGYTYQWADGASGPLRDDLSSGSYGLTISDADGRRLSDTLLVIPGGEPVVVAVEIGDATADNDDGYIQLSPSGGVAPYSFQWSAFPDEVTATINDLPAGTYDVTVTDVTGCTVTISVTVSQTTATATLQDRYRLRAEPNPTAGRVVLRDGPRSLIDRCVATDVLGRQTIFEGVGRSNVLDLSALPAGVYAVDVYYRTGARGNVRVSKF